MPVIRQIIRFLVACTGITLLAAGSCDPALDPYPVDTKCWPLDEVRDKTCEEVCRLEPLENAGSHMLRCDASESLGCQSRLQTLYFDADCSGEFIRVEATCDEPIVSDDASHLGVQCCCIHG